MRTLWPQAEEVLMQTPARTWMLRNKKGDPVYVRALCFLLYTYFFFYFLFFAPRRLVLVLPSLGGAGADRV